MIEIVIYPDNSIIKNGEVISIEEANQILNKYRIDLKRDDDFVLKRYNFKLCVFSSKGGKNRKYKKKKHKKIPKTLNWWKPTKKKGKCSDV